MDRVEVTAKASGFTYEGIPRPEGTVFECSRYDALRLSVIGKVALPEGCSAEDLTERPAPPARQKRKGYRRRDMVAEG